eukprot:4195998-Pyramimonas_sp.AAC.1
MTWSSSVGGRSQLPAPFPLAERSCAARLGGRAPRSRCRRARCSGAARARCALALGSAAAQSQSAPRAWSARPAPSASLHV